MSCSEVPCAAVRLATARVLPVNMIPHELKTNAVEYDLVIPLTSVYEKKCMSKIVFAVWYPYFRHYPAMETWLLVFMGSKLDGREEFRVLLCPIYPRGASHEQNLLIDGRRIHASNRDRARVGSDYDYDNDVDERTWHNHSSRFNHKQIYLLQGSSPETDCWRGAARSGYTVCSSRHYHHSIA